MGKDIEMMRAAGRCAREVLDATGRAVKPGVTTDELDAVAHAATIERGAYPSPLNYHGFPKSICTSVNEVICHGIPDDVPLREGDVVNVDVTVYLDGFHGGPGGAGLAEGRGDAAGRSRRRSGRGGDVGWCRGRRGTVAA